MKLSPTEQVDVLADCGLTWNARLKDFATARDTVRKWGCCTISEFRKRVRKSDSKSIPLNPETRYNDSGWAGWNDFLGIPEVTYEDAVVAVRAMGITSGSAYKEAYRMGELPRGFPANPASVFKDRWAGWGKFLGCSISFDEKSRRTKEGLQKAKEGGRRLGRPNTLTHLGPRHRQVVELKDAGLSYGKIADKMGMSRGWAFMAFKEASFSENFMAQCRKSA